MFIQEFTCNCLINSIFDIHSHCFKDLKLPQLRLLYDLQKICSQLFEDFLHCDLINLSLIISQIFQVQNSLFFLFYFSFEVFSTTLAIFVQTSKEEQFLLIFLFFTDLIIALLKQIILHRTKLSVDKYSSTIVFFV